ncbi:MAG TPA: hypothetical protein VNO52_07870 [Methylomirabilota bacterium]|nr:hypothetical protein [Methylomirabilota bacterium]
MKKQNLIRVVVLTAVFAWPGVETVRYWRAKQELAASTERLNAVSVKYASLKGIEVANKTLPTRKP